MRIKGIHAASSDSDSDNESDDQAPKRDSLLLILAVGVGGLIIALAVVLLLVFRYSSHPIKTADRSLGDQIVQADADLQTALDAAQTSYNTALGLSDDDPSASAGGTDTPPPQPSSTDSSSSDAVTLSISDPSIVALVATMEEAQSLHNTAMLLLEGRVTSLESTPSVVYADATYGTDFETSGQIPTSGFDLSTVVSLHVTSAQVTAWLPGLATATTDLGTQTKAVDQALADAKFSGGMTGFDSAVSDLTDAIATAQMRLNLTQGQVADQSTWDGLKAAIAAAQIVLDNSSSITPGVSTPDEVTAATQAVTDATANLNEQSRLVMASNQLWQSTHPGQQLPHTPPPSATPTTPTPSGTSTTTTAPPTNPTTPPTTDSPTATPTPSEPSPPTTDSPTPPPTTDSP